jgi:hypothetical protein
MLRFNLNNLGFVLSRAAARSREFAPCNTYFAAIAESPEFPVFLQSNPGGCGESRTKISTRDVGQFPSGFHLSRVISSWLTNVDRSNGTLDFVRRNRTWDAKPLDRNLRP